LGRQNKIEWHFRIKNKTVPKSNNIREAITVVTKIVIAKILQAALLLLMLASVLGFLTFANVYGFFLASLTALIAWGLFKKMAWAYFAAAVWGLACYQLAKQGYEFQAIKHKVMLLGVVVIPVAIFLHEMRNYFMPQPAQKSVTNSTSNEDLPQ
jgi:hypothetical protein